MQLETKRDLSYIADHTEYDFRYAAIVDEHGQEREITPKMIDRLYERLCAENTIRHALKKHA
ncbi:hypothetical protein GP5015_1837 [gamma proteobacterium HTCC5015]|nr:hypothetical protein GP5015_1837 [gamma proteobacterium HTCC5015]